MSNGGDKQGSINEIIMGVLIFSLIPIILSFWFPKISIGLLVLLAIIGIAGEQRKAGRIAVVVICVAIFFVRMVPALMSDWEEAEEEEKVAAEKKELEDQEKKRIANLLETTRKDASNPEKAADVVSAFEELEGKVNLSPDDYQLLAKALLNKAKNEHKKEQLKLAMADVLKAKKYIPNDKEIVSLEKEIRGKYSARLVDHINTLVKAEHWGEAMKDYNTLKKVSPETASSKEIKKLIATMERKVKVEEKKKRRAEIKELLATGQAELKAKNYDSAKSTFEKVLELDPKNSVAKRKIASISRLAFIKEINDEKYTTSFTVSGSTAVWKKQEDCECVDMLGPFETAQKIFKTLRNVKTIKIIGTGKYFDKFANEKTTTTLKWTLKRGPTLKLNLDNIAHKTNRPGTYIFKMFRPWIPRQCCYTAD